MVPHKEPEEKLKVTHQYRALSYSSVLCACRQSFIKLADVEKVLCTLKRTFCVYLYLKKSKSEKSSIDSNKGLTNYTAKQGKDQRAGAKINLIKINVGPLNPPAAPRVILTECCSFNLFSKFKQTNHDDLNRMI